MTKYLSGIRTGSLEETEEFLPKSVDDFAAGDGAVWAIELRDATGSEDERSESNGPWGTIGVTRRDSRVILG